MRSDPTPNPARSPGRRAVSLLEHTEPTASPGAPELLARRADARVRRRARLPGSVRRAVVVALVVAVGTLGWSLGTALTRPGGDPLGTKFVEWVRDHGGNGLVNRIEN